MSNENSFLPQPSSLNPLAQADILIVDDVLENIHLLSTILDSSGYETRKATNGKMALTAIATTLPSLVLLDIRMPEISGYEVCQRLKADPKTAHIPVIFLSAADDVTDKVEAFRIGGADYITKPFHMEEVLARVQHQLAIVAAQQTIHQLNVQLEQRIKERTQQLEAANAQLLNMAFRDPLTQLPNRALLMKRLQTLLEPSNSHHRFAVFYLDCDRFKIVNDSLGHPAGDELLMAIAHRLQSVLRSQDLLFRLGGDEFVVLLNHPAEADTAIEIAQGISNCCSAPFSLREREFFISFSIGIVLDCLAYRNPEELLRDADIAMYQAKSLGKDQYQIFNPLMYQQICHRIQLETDLRKAILNEEFVLHYQPIVELATGAIVGVEALVRWYHPEAGLTPPNQFIPIAEETGLILKLGHWVLEAACQQLYAWQQQRFAHSSFSVSVNVSAHQLAQENYVKQIDEVLAKTQLDPQCLNLEITETVIMQSNNFAASVIRDLRDRHIRLSIDDFGTGYSSLSYLHSFPLDHLKVDRSFIQRLHEESSLSLVTAIVQVAKTMDMRLIAEGIETTEQLTQLKLLGCQMGQGYLFSKPLPVEEMTNLLAQSLGGIANG
ncbi:GGDEF domain-containing response regulator [Leptolyngbya sp. FACHB-711]|uniref:EAL domain-containing response regulator n=1 Tax=Leptolyngbya sp. FACHB-711 TaxID=2692813 RepID=UPI0016825935|nr:GGDEF domain-containing response regulator [Leptolyngbya sp. FACHB-711]MBD1849220.1 EAL domain-containing protein [Cyanobacteria bacterium FACHB-502]MBD2025122.1 EAL domain-containing protein [Leptolyngbya sp. FACHB-711]